MCYFCPQWSIKHKDFLNRNIKNSVHKLLKWHFNKIKIIKKKIKFIRNAFSRKDLKLCKDLKVRKILLRKKKFFIELF